MNLGFVFVCGRFGRFFGVGFGSKVIYRVIFVKFLVCVWYGVVFKFSFLVGFFVGLMFKLCFVRRGGIGLLRGVWVLVVLGGG